MHKKSEKVKLSVNLIHADPLPPLGTPSDMKTSFIHLLLKEGGGGQRLFIKTIKKTDVSLSDGVPQCQNSTKRDNFFFANFLNKC